MDIIPRICFQLYFSPKKNPPINTNNIIEPHLMNKKLSKGVLKFLSRSKIINVDIIPRIQTIIIHNDCDIDNFL